MNDSISSIGNLTNRKSTLGSQFDLLDLMFAILAFAIIFAEWPAEKFQNGSIPIAWAILSFINGTILAACFLLLRRVFIGNASLFGEPGCGLLFYLGTNAFMQVVFSICLSVFWAESNRVISLTRPFNGIDQFYLGFSVLRIIVDFGILTVAMSASMTRWRCFFVCLLVGVLLELLNHLTFVAFSSSFDVFSAGNSTMLGVVLMVFQLSTWLPLVFLAVAVFMDFRDGITRSWFHWFGLLLFLSNYLYSLVFFVLARFLSFEQLYGPSV